MHTRTDIIGAIGGTPLVELTRVVPGGSARHAHRTTTETAGRRQKRRTTMPELLFLLIVGFVGLVIGIPSYVTWQRRWPGMIAGFDRSRCSDVDGLTRWVGGVGMIIGGACLLAAVVMYVAPEYLVAVSVILGLVLVAGSVATNAGCQRFTKR
jgi:hypothetical protein